MITVLQDTIANIEYHVELNKLNIELTKIFDSVSNATLVFDIIETHGLTPSLESLLVEGANNEISMESIKDMITVGINKIKALIKRIIDYIKKFFKNYHKKLNSVKKSLQKRLNIIDGKIDWYETKKLVITTGTMAGGHHKHAYNMRKLANELLSKLLEGPVDPSEFDYSSGSYSMKMVDGKLKLTIPKTETVKVKLDDIIDDPQQLITSPIHDIEEADTALALDVSPLEKELKQLGNNTEEAKALQLRISLYSTLTEWLLRRSIRSLTWHLNVSNKIVIIKEKIKINKNLQKAIDDKNLIGGYAVISTLLGKDLWLPKLETPFLVEYADIEFKKKGITFFVPDDGDTEFPSKDKWDEDLWYLLCVRLDYNFSRKKFDFIIEIMTYLRETGHPDFQAS